jgi:hypothetical protein
MCNKFEVAGSLPSRICALKSIKQLSVLDLFVDLSLISMLNYKAIRNVWSPYCSEEYESKSIERCSETVREEYVSEN